MTLDRILTFHQTSSAWCVTALHLVLLLTATASSPAHSASSGGFASVITKNRLAEVNAFVQQATADGTFNKAFHRWMAVSQ